MYEVFEHTADLGLRIVAADLESLYRDAARGLFSLIVTNLDDVQSVEEVSFAIPGHERDLLLFDWLSELLYTFETRRLLFAEFTVGLNDAGLQATARGESLDASRHMLANEVKAVTYHGLKVEKTDCGWCAELIVDI